MPNGGPASNMVIKGKKNGANSDPYIEDRREHGIGDIDEWRHTGQYELGSLCGWIGIRPSYILDQLVFGTLLYLDSASATLPSSIPRSENNINSIVYLLSMRDEDRRSPRNRYISKY